MRYPASEKLEIIRLVEQSHLPAGRTLEKLGILRSTFYRWYDRYQAGGPEALEDRPSTPRQVWNRIPDEVRERIVKDIRRATRKQYSAEEKIRIVLDGLRGEHSIAELCRREGIAESLYYNWSKEFLEAGKRRLAGDTARAATSSEVKDLRQEAKALKEVVAEQALELRLLKKSMIADGDGEE